MESSSIRRTRVSPLATAGPSAARGCSRRPRSSTCSECPVRRSRSGLGRKGLPVGVQVAAARGNDHVSIAVAIELERSLGGWVPPASHSA